MSGIARACSSAARSHKARDRSPRSVYGRGAVFPGRGEVWPAWVFGAKRRFVYTRNMRTVKVLTGALSSSVSELVVSASAVVSDIPPEGRNTGGLMYGTSGAPRVDGPASAFLYRVGRVRDTPYGWYHPVGIASVLVGAVMGQWEVFAFSCGKVSAGLCRNNQTRALTM